MSQPPPTTAYRAPLPQSTFLPQDEEESIGAGDRLLYYLRKRKAEYIISLKTNEGMSPRQCMIVDLELLGSGREFRTEEIEAIQDNSRAGHWLVRFRNSPKEYDFHKERLLYLTAPEQIDLGDRGLYANDRLISNVDELLRFSNQEHTFYYVSIKGESPRCLHAKEIYITRTPLSQIGRSVWGYLCKLAEETGLQTEGAVNLLSRQYQLIDIKQDKAILAKYLDTRQKLATYRMPGQIYYPFGCNASQKSAVERALTHQLSIIQGPPGTGKTQTILNIIANLLLSDKTVLVVSNNNSAVENVAEKLEREGLGFLVAQLGNADNKEAFVSQQRSISPDLSEWMLKDPSSLKRQAQEALQAVAQGFDDQTRLSLLKSELQALQTEERHHDLEQGYAQQESRWLSSKPSPKLIRLLHLYKNEVEQNGQQPSWWFRLKWALSLGMPAFWWLKGEPREIGTRLEKAFYQARKAEIEQEIDAIMDRLREQNTEERTRELTETSLQLLKYEMARHYSQRARRVFTLRDIKTQAKAFLSEYPIVLSSTYSAKTSINPEELFDYVIMDEASQVDLKTGVLALSCAKNAVIVGDDKQLPNVVSSTELQVHKAIQSIYKVDDRYNAVKNSFLQSCAKVFASAPVTLLREHYRCHPKIIEFCNQRFYDGSLITMTTDKGEEDALRVVRTTKGNHARERLNQREIDVIAQEIMPEYTDADSIGIITPYQDQARAINNILGKDIASTVHRYQGRECDTIIISTVKNSPTTFSDNDSLLNVAISRARKRLIIVCTGNEIPEETNLAQLIGYVQYNNCEVAQSGLHSVFDLLYKQYTAERLAYLAQRPRGALNLSEELAHSVLSDALGKLGLRGLGILSHYPLHKLICDYSLLDDEEQAFAEHPLSHLDLLVYNTTTKRPLLAFEVDGWSYHRGGAKVRQVRDALKDSILSRYALPLHRLATTDIVTTETMMELISKILPSSSSEGLPSPDHLS